MQSIVRATFVAAVFAFTTIAWGASMTHHAKGRFDVKIAPTGQPDTGPGSVLGQMSLEKTFHGGMTGTSRGTMLTASSVEKVDSGVYVAVERFTGTVDGKKGSFALAHRGVQANGGRELLITIVPDTGSEELQGISGTFAIEIGPDGAHSYDLAYSLPD
ncbi:DUF3224 domain-containing protein [Luteibacter aegosomatissinici]|uniref:DUF3224 domain-containing protein n=1 Tax=Luteibacter aegosomatissinici TaxID=2911539 RepID=UPI001FFBC718|nr:DUF3224 domain-containing protein [Luteibacter aegosomatissinici]UPG93215.1 DUF3224 domain-containing protein [Luteibacter aegosomatissinici]